MPAFRPALSAAVRNNIIVPDRTEPSHVPALLPAHTSSTPGDDVETPIWDTYKEIIRKYDDRGDAVVGNIERFAFYDEAKTAYAIIATGESALYANVMLQKGVVTD